MVVTCPNREKQIISSYVDNVLQLQKNNIPSSSKLKRNVNWNIIKTATKKSINCIFSEFEKILLQTGLEYTPTSNSSFQIFIPENTHTYSTGVRKIIISLDLMKNDNILHRIKNREFVIEVSIHNENNNYMTSDFLSYSKQDYIKYFDSKDFKQNIKDTISEVIHIITYQDHQKNCHVNY